MRKEISTNYKFKILKKKSQNPEIQHIFLN